MKATIDAQQTLIKGAQAKIDELSKSIGDRDARYRQDSADLAKQFQGSMTQVLSLIGQRANLPVPITITTPAPTKENPNPAPHIEIPKADFPAAKAYVEDCEQCKIDRARLRADAADREKQMALAQEQIDALKKERDSAVKAVKGGSWIHRAGRNLKVILCSGAGAAAGSGQGAKGAAAGAIAGALACSLF